MAIEDLYQKSAEIKSGSAAKLEEYAKTVPGWARKLIYQSIQEALPNEQKWAVRSSEFLRTAENRKKELENHIMTHFAIALERQDAPAIYEIAKAVESAKRQKIKSGDRIRRTVLTYKMLFDRMGIRMPISWLARNLNWPKSDAQNGYHQLRRICKALKFPISKKMEISDVEKANRFLALMNEQHK